MPWLVFATCAGGGPGAFCPGICAVAIVEAASKSATTGIGTDEQKLGWKTRSMRSMFHLDFLFASILMRCLCSRTT
jgi:hypothetical protein